MQFLARRAQFQHFARDHDAPLGRHGGQRIHHGVQGCWIGIVAIVDDGDVTHLDDLPAFVCRGERRQRPTASEGLRPRSSPAATAASAL